MAESSRCDASARRFRAYFIESPALSRRGTIPSLRGSERTAPAGGFQVELQLIPAAPRLRRALHEMRADGAVGLSDDNRKRIRNRCRRNFALQGPLVLVEEVNHRVTYRQQSGGSIVPGRALGA
jgi:hypothetical protein